MIKSMTEIKKLTNMNINTLAAPQLRHCIQVRKNRLIAMYLFYIRNQNKNIITEQVVGISFLI